MSSGRLQSGKQLVTEKNIGKEVKKYKNLKTKKSWSSFEEFCDYQTRLWQISFTEAIRANQVEVPNSAKTVQLHDMPKRGRPSRVSKALQIDNPPQKRKQTSTVAGTSKKTKK